MIINAVAIHLTTAPIKWI